MEGRHTIGILVRDQPGVLQRICGLFGRRGFNIDSLSVGSSEQAGLSRMTLVLKGDDRAHEQLCKQLNKLMDIVHIELLSGRSMIARELMLARIRVEPGKRSEVMGIAEAFRCPVIDVGPDSLMIQVVGDVDKNHAFVQLLVPYGILELARTGETAMRRGE